MNRHRETIRVMPCLPELSCELVTLFVTGALECKTSLLRPKVSAAKVAPYGYDILLNVRKIRALESGAEITCSGELFVQLEQNVSFSMYCRVSERSQYPDDYESVLCSCFYRGDLAVCITELRGALWELLFSLEFISCLDPECHRSVGQGRGYLFIDRGQLPHVL